MTPVFLTIDTEIAWRHFAAGRDFASIVARSFHPAGVGVGAQLAMLARHGLKACFFVDPMPALLVGLDPFRRIVDLILGAKQEIQLHCHPNWARARVMDRGTDGSFELVDYSQRAQRDLIATARDLLVSAGAPAPVAFRAGSYAANDATLAALATLGFRFDSSHNGAEQPWPSAVGLPRNQISPVRHRGVIEMPVSLIEETPGRFRNFQICALSIKEMRAAIDHAVARNHAATTIVGHSFELANRDGTRANRVHVRRFESLCGLLGERRDVAPTAHFADARPIALGREDSPLAPNLLRRRWRQGEQLWSNLVEERAA